jgi:hypothetical protein
VNLIARVSAAGLEEDIAFSFIIVVPLFKGRIPAIQEKNE